MSTVPKPATQKAMTDQLWSAVIGTNGDGLCSQVRELRKLIMQILFWCIGTIFVSQAIVLTVLRFFPPTP